jgi:hypothetical protein
MLYSTKEDTVTERREHEMNGSRQQARNKHSIKRVINKE